MNSLPPSVLRARILLRSVTALPGAEGRIYRRILSQPAQPKSHNTLGLKLAIITAGVVSAGSMAYGLGILPRVERPRADVVVTAPTSPSSPRVLPLAARRTGLGAVVPPTASVAPLEPSSDSQPATAGEARSTALDTAARHRAVATPPLAAPPVIAPSPIAAPIAPTPAADFAAGDAPLAPETELGPNVVPRTLKGSVTCRRRDG